VKIHTRKVAECIGQYYRVESGAVKGNMRGWNSGGMSIVEEALTAVAYELSGAYIKCGIKPEHQ
jgi:hypothetical protein